MRIKSAILLSMFPAFLDATPNCPESHCSHISKRLNEFCIANGMAGKPYLVLKDGEDCYCPCSCVTGDTKVSLWTDEYLRVSMLAKGSQVLTPLSEGQTSKVHNVLHSDVKEGTIYTITFSNGNSLRVSENHTFVSPTFKAIKAEELKVGDKVLDRNEQEITVSSSEKQTNFTGALYNVIVAKEQKYAEDHVFVTNGILSGDFLLQSINDSVGTGLKIRSELLLE